MASMQDALNNNYQGMTHTGRKPQGMQFAQDAMQGIQNAPGNILKWAQNNPVDAAFMAASTAPVVGDAIGFGKDVYDMSPMGDTPFTATNTALAGAGLLPFVPAGMGSIKKTAGSMTDALQKSKKSATNKSSGGGRSTPPSNVPRNGVLQPLPTYPPMAPPEWKRATEGLSKKDIGTAKDKQFRYDAKVDAGEAYPATMVYPAKVNSPEALAVKKQAETAQRDIDAGNYTPMFDVSKRTDVDPTNYNLGPSSRDVAVPAQAATIAKYEELANNPEGLQRLANAYSEGKLIPNSENWYFVKQLEDEFVRELGEDAGRLAFREKFAKPMAATTGGASPKENLRTAMYGNYIRENNMPYPAAASDMPYPAGGQYVTGNMQQHEKMMNAGNIDAATNAKRHNFESNFLGDTTSATIDKQMSQLFDPKIAAPPGASYGIYENALGRLAKKEGVEPRAFQDVAWAGAKKQREGARYPGSRPMIEEVNQAIERTARITGLTPQQVLVEGIIKSKIPIYGAGGVVMAPSMIKALQGDEQETINAPATSR